MICVRSSSVCWAIVCWAVVSWAGVYGAGVCWAVVSRGDISWAGVCWVVMRFEPTSLEPTFLEPSCLEPLCVLSQRILSQRLLSRCVLSHYAFWANVSWAVVRACLPVAGLDPVLPARVVHERPSRAVPPRHRGRRPQEPALQDIQGTTPRPTPFSDIYNSPAHKSLLYKTFKVPSPHAILWHP